MSCRKDPYDRILNIGMCHIMYAQNSGYTAYTLYFV